MDTEESPQVLAQAVAALERHLAEQNKLRAETNRLYEQRLDLERKRLDLTEENNQLYLRWVIQQEENGQSYKRRMVEQRVASRWALVIFIVLLLIGLSVAAVFFPTGHHPR